jgi:hypothetical protein
MTAPQVVTWSHSALKDFEGCARRHHEVKVLNRHPFVDTTHTIYGKEVHTAIEDYIDKSLPIPEKYIFVKPVVDTLLSKKGRKFAEYEMALTPELKPCKFSDPGRWVRGIADLIIVDDDNLTARVIDWKTGNDRYPDRDQLVLMSLMVFAYFPHVRQVNSALFFVVKGSMIKHKMIREDIDAAWWKYRERVAKLSAAYEHNVWNPTRSPLCGWCPVKSCSFNTKR